MITILSIAFCEGGVADGFQWPRTIQNSVAELPCSSASSLFRRETVAFRPCLNDGRWGEPDLTTCTLQQDAQPFLLIRFALDFSAGGGEGGGTVTPIPPGFSVDGTPDDETRRLLEAEV